ncbi:MAG: hypothetical protein IJP53_09295 [Synergistaceae bacterium]|nr:hypothetical protein [Synergistaceae bacterium]MBR0094658.1 hypothetical protein [Synergistaceae bacterium]
MTENDRRAFNDIMDAVNDLTIMPGGKDLARMKQILFANLMDYPLEVIANALNAHCRVEKFFPMLADIIRQIEGTPDERALLAWSLVMKAKRKYKLRKAIRFPAPAIHFAIERMGGWEKFFWSVDDYNESFKSAEFQKLYKIGEKCSSWDGENGKIKVCPYFPSEEEIYALKKGNKKFRREVFDVESDRVITENLKQIC